MRATDPLNERQLQVLRWVAEGCPDGVMPDHTHKKSARALQSRRLIKIRKGKGAWSATLTDAGIHYLQHGSIPPSNKAPKSPATRPPSNRPSKAKTKKERTVPEAEHQRSASAARPALPPKLSPTEQLVADVVAADGVLEVSKESGYGSSYRVAELVRNANRHGKTPPGKRLVHKVVRDGNGWLGPQRHVFSLEEGPAGTHAPLAPVPVPNELNRYHPAVSTLRKSNRMEVTQAVQKRALRILHAVAVEAEHRGFTVSLPTQHTTTDRRTGPSWHLVLTAANENVPLRISEEVDRVEHVATPSELREQQRHPWVRVPSHDHVSSGRLRIDVGGTVQSERKSFWADRTSWTLDDKLPELLREISVRADELRLRREAKDRAEKAYQQAVERERDSARTRAAEARRRKVLEDQLGRWREARELRDFAAAVAQRIDDAEATGGTPDEEITQARRWLAWITERADSADPLKKLPAWPEPQELRPYELTQFMNRIPEPLEMAYQPQSY